MEGVDHVHVVQVGRGGFVGDVHGVLEGQIPDGEGLELRVSGLHPALVLLVQLAQADGHLSAARTGGGDHHERLRRLHEIVLAEAFVRVDEGDVLRIAGDGMMVVDPDAEVLQALPVDVGASLPVVVGDDDGAHLHIPLEKLLAQAQHIHIVGDTQVAADLVLLDIHCAHDYHHLEVVLELHQHLELDVRLESGQNPAGVEVVEKLAAHFHVKLVAETGDALTDVFALDLKVFLAVEPVLHRILVFVRDTKVQIFSVPTVGRR